MTKNDKMLNIGSPRLLFDRAASAAIVAEARAPALARQAASEAAITALKQASLPPGICGPDIPMAPARGAFYTFRPVTIVPGSAGATQAAGYQARGEERPRVAIVCADVFDAMILAARRIHDRRGDGVAGFTPPFTPAQVSVARDYRAMTERRAAGGMRCASLETTGHGGGAGGEFIDAYVAEGLRLAAFHRRIGQGAALSVRRIRPSARGPGKRRLISDRALVDAVCLGGKTLSAVLKAYDWVQNRAMRETLRKALAAALDRMQGYDAPRTTK